MSINIRYDSKLQTVMSGVIVHADDPFAYTGDDRLHRAVHGDMFLRAIAPGPCWFVRDRLRTVPEVFSFVGGLPPDGNFVVSTRPVVPDAGIGSRYDDVFYGNISRNFQLFFSAISGKSFVAPSASNEKPVRHATFSGELMTKRVGLPLSPYTSEVYNHTLTWLRSDYVLRSCQVNSLDPLLATQLAGSHGSGDFDLEDFVRQLADKTFWSGHIYNSNEVFFDVMSNVTSERTTDRFRISYDMEMSSENYYHQYYKWHATMSIPLGVPTPSVQPYIGGQYGVQYGEGCTFVYTFSESEPYSGGPSTIFWWNSNSNNFRVYPTMLGGLSIDVDAEARKSVTCFVSLSGLRSPLESFKRSVDRSLFEIVPSSLFSTVDAFKVCEGYLGTNVLQNLAKLPNISSMLPKVLEAADIIGRLARRDFSLLTIKQILNLLSSTTLQASFQWRPTIDLLKKYLPEMASTLHSLGDIKENAIGYGSFRFRFTSGEFGREEVTLLTRTKLVMDASPSGLLSAVLGIDALGMLPKASNLWDLLPFSFVANWFTGVGNAMRNAEYSLLLATIPAYFVHTYTITSPLTVDELDQLEMSNASTVPAALRIYYRDITLYNPIPRDSRFGFGIPKELPPLGVLGSLLYQLIFS